MRSWGLMLFVVGVGSLFAPKLGFRFVIIGAFGEAAPTAGIIAAVAGIGLMLMSLRSSGKTSDGLDEEPGDHDGDGPRYK